EWPDRRLVPHSRVQRGGDDRRGPAAHRRARARCPDRRRRRRLHRRHGGGRRGVRRRSPARRAAAPAKPRQGRGGAPGGDADDAGDRGHPGRRHGVRPRRRHRADRADRARRRRRRLRLAAERRRTAARLPLLASDRQSLPVAADRRAVQHDAQRHGDRLQGLPRRCAALPAPDTGRLRDRARDHRRGLSPQAAHLRDADRLLRAHVRRGQEHHVARRLQGDRRAAPGPAAATV
ncbi:MAG: hypothetical protein AVDCRST_MAG67-1510, partial [uncultured Solirubrobacteraceae bacterium]